MDKVMFRTIYAMWEYFVTKSHECLLVIGWFNCKHHEPDGNHYMTFKPYSFPHSNRCIKCGKYFK